MVRFVRWMLLPAVLGWLIPAAPVAAQNRSEFVNDEAGFFSKEAKAKANAEIARMGSQFKKELVVDTVVTVKRPAEVDSNDTAAVNRFFDSWAEKKAAREKVNGIYMVIVQNPPKVRVLEGTKTERSGAFSSTDRKELEQQVIANLKAAHKEGMKNQAKNDKVLLDATTFVHERMSQHARQAADHPQQPGAGHGAQQPNAGGTHWLTYILIGIGVFLVVWLILGIVRGLSGAGRGPGMAGGGGGYGGGGGGGGGGFFSSMLGGLFGAAAGMWMYNNFFGGHSSSAWGAGPDGGAGPGAGNDADASYTGSGGDYGDTGGDGGDQGGGGDAGGGDWGSGGGGGDSGGGGGDWGGGGGGDFGGGGGGGDW